MSSSPISTFALVAKPSSSLRSTRSVSQGSGIGLSMDPTSFSQTAITRVQPSPLGSASGHGLGIADDWLATAASSVSVKEGCPSPGLNAAIVLSTASSQEASSDHVGASSYGC